MKRTIKHRIGRYMIITALLMMIIALARPQTTRELVPIKQQGIDIAMVLDVSGTMKSVDFKPDRLEVARDTIENFIKERVEDRISLIIFAGTAYTRVPLTLDHNVVRESLEEVSTNSVNRDGTAIGMGISVGLNRLKKSQASSKVIILVTDGDNNAGAINPETAAQLASDLGIKIYTIGVGTDETILPYSYFGEIRYQRVEGGLNEELLKKIAENTDGKYFRAKDSNALTRIFENINQLEKSSFQEEDFKEYNELAFMIVKIALILLLIGIFLDRYYFIQIP